MLEYPTLALDQYPNRHNRVVLYLHWKICKHCGAQNAENCMNISQKLSQKLIMLPSYGITAYKQTEKVKANKPDITVKDKREKTCELIDLKIPAKKFGSSRNWKAIQI